MPEPRGRIEELFVVRLWRENSEPMRGWRGSAEHVGAKRRFYFSSLADLMEFIRIRIGGSQNDHA